MDYTPILQQLKALAEALVNLLPPLGLFGGFVFLLSAGKELAFGKARTGEPNLTGVGVRILVAGALLNFSGMVNSLRDTTGGAGVEVRSAMLSAVPSGSSEAWKLAMDTALIWVACIGFFGIFRGFLLLNKAGSGDSQDSGGDTFWAAFWHLIGGALCVNIGLR